MKRLMIILTATAAAAALSACEPPSRDDRPEVAEAPIKDVVADAAEDNAVPVVAPDAPPVDNATLPPDKRSSEESVQPESETLFF